MVRPGLIERSEVRSLAGIGGVPMRCAAVAVQVVRLVQFPDLVAQGVLDGVAALFSQAVGPDVAVFDEVGTMSAGIALRRWKS